MDPADCGGMGRKARITERNTRQTKITQMDEEKGITEKTKITQMDEEKGITEKNHRRETRITRKAKPAQMDKENCRITTRFTHSISNLKCYCTKLAILL